MIWSFGRRAKVQNPHPEDYRSDAALRDTQEPRSRRYLRWNLVLVWFMRLMALLWIAKGLSFWAVIIGAGTVIPAFEDRAVGFQATVIYFSIVDLIAAVGLWLASTWGGVLWLLAVMSHLILALFFPGILPVNMVLAMVYVGLMGTYLLISWLASGEEQ
ncbi:MAG TPA: DUF6163 family protein [Saliniramus sp.]|nr:DUF6163 family protein [Saliniramus sp.]